MEISKMRLPTCAEYDSLVKATGGNDTIMHWRGMLSWCQDTDPDYPSYRAVRGYPSARDWYDSSATNRYASVGFRPAFEILNPDTLDPDETVITVGTLYMDNKPIKVSQNPVWDGDIPDYVPGAKLELREAVDNPAYQVQAIRVGNVLIADRVLLKCISWNDIQEALSGKEPESQENKPQPGKMRLPTCTGMSVFAPPLKS